MTTIYYIYGLFSPEGELRYIGQTRQSIKNRLADHLKDTYKNCHKARWINKLLGEGEAPYIQVIQQLYTKEDLSEAEKYWIAFFRALRPALKKRTKKSSKKDASFYLLRALRYNHNKVLQDSSGQIYPTIKHAARYLNISACTLAYRLRVNKEIVEGVSLTWVAPPEGYEKYLLAHATNMHERPI